MRSSIACVRCRRSKVKCVNNGVNTTCRSCEASGRECTYPVPVSGSRKREDSLTGSSARVDDAGDGEPRRQRPRKSTLGNANAPSQSSEQAAPTSNNPLDPSLLTPTVWQELFDIYQGHFSTDLPFIHPPTFSKPLRQASAAHGLGKGEQTASRPPVSEEFLLAFLALTSRFHPRIIAVHSPVYANPPDNPLAASDYYASLARFRVLQTSLDSSSVGDIEHVQALLMLTFYEWSVSRGGQAWTYLGLAIRSAQAMGLGFEEELDDQPVSSCLGLEENGLDERFEARRSSSLPENDDQNFLRQEIRRRTMWSCLILESYLSNGKYRPASLSGEAFSIQLPVSEQAFLFGNRVETTLFTNGVPGTAKRKQITTRMREEIISEARRRNLSEKEFRELKHTAEKEDEDRESDTLSSLYVEASALYNKCIIRICKQPWNSRDLKTLLAYFTQNLPRTLPRQFHLNPQNTSAHINLRTSSAYSLLHFSALTCSILLERHNLPLCPLRMDRLTDHSVTKAWSHQHHPQERQTPSSWLSALATCCEASRKIIDLAQTCQEWNVLVETPIVIFALYLSAFTNIYCTYFPWMVPDRGNGSCGPCDPVEDVKTSLNLLDGMRSRLPLATHFVKTLWKLCSYLDQMRHDFERSGAYHETSRVVQQALNDETSMRDRDRLTNYILRFRHFEEEEDQDKTDSAVSERYSVDRRTSIIPASDLGSPETSRTSMNGHAYRRSVDANTNPSSTQRQKDRWSIVNNGASTTQTQPQQHGQPQGSFRAYSSGYDTASPNPPTSIGGQHPYRGPVSEDHVPPSASGWTTTNGHSQAMTSTSVTASTMPPPPPQSPYSHHGLTQPHQSHRQFDSPTEIQDRERERDVPNVSNGPGPGPSSISNSTDRASGNVTALQQSGSGSGKDFLSTLPTVMFTAEDVAAFVEGCDVREFARRDAERRPRFAGDFLGWLGVVYGFC